MKEFFKNLLTGTLIVATMFVLGTCSVKCAYAVDMSYDHELSVGYKDMLAGHSEGATDRCMNGGFGIDVEYRLPFNLDFNKLIGLSLVPGGMLTYSNFETAYRRTATSPESQQKRESSLRVTGTLRPTLRIWKVRLYRVYGFGYDYNQPDNRLAFGFIRPDDSRGIGIDFTDSVSINAEEYKFIRFDATTYRYRSVNLTIAF